MEIRPAIDIIGGRCVRLKQGDYAQETVYHEDPLDAAKMFEDAGLTHLHLVDLDGAIANHVVNYKSLERIATETNLQIDFGGGLKTTEDVELVFNAGASQITGGSIAVKDSLLFWQWLERWGPKKIILGADVREDVVAVHGWKEDTGLSLLELVYEYRQKGIEYVISTDISKDGALEGPATQRYAKLLDSFPSMKLIASGGVTTMQDVYDLRGIGCFGAIIGKAIYEGRISLKELGEFVQNQGANQN